MIDKNWPDNYFSIIVLDETEEGCITKANWSRKSEYRLCLALSCKKLNYRSSTYFNVDS